MITNLVNCLESPESHFTTTKMETSIVTVKKEMDWTISIQGSEMNKVQRSFRKEVGVSNSEMLEFPSWECDMICSSLKDEDDFAETASQQQKGQQDNTGFRTSPILYQASDFKIKQLDHLKQVIRVVQLVRAWPDGVSAIDLNFAPQGPISNIVA